MKLFENRFIAHRGLHQEREVPENSLLAFQKAVDKLYSIELDITITKDEQIVVFHDDNLFRLCEVNKNIEDVEYSYLKKLYLYDTKEYIPLLEEVLYLVKSKTSLIIEIKKHRYIGVLELKLIELLKSYSGKYYICSFEKDILFWFKNYNPNIKRGLIFEPYSNKFKKYNKTLFMYKYIKSKPNFISLDYKLINSSIYEYCKKHKLPIISWTVDNIKIFEEINKKVDAVIFEQITL